MAEIAFHKKRRGVIWTSLTKLGTKLTELEAEPKGFALAENARSLADKLKTLKQDFKDHQLAIIDRTDGEAGLAEEQQVLDDNDDLVSGFSIRIQRLLSSATPSTTPEAVRVATKQLTLLQANLESIKSTVAELDDSDEDFECTLEEYQDQASELKAELPKLRTSLLSSEVIPKELVMQNLSRVDKAAFDCLLAIKKRLRSVSTSTTTTTGATPGTKLPKLELPTFHGDILQWKNFWEQFCVFVHDRVSIPKEEKLMYLQNAIKDKTAKNLIAGLTKSSEHYDKAIRCLQERYDRPRQIHQTHVRRIVEASPLKDGTGKEIRALHDVVVQHLRALKSLGHEPSQAFITLLLEMKLDPTTMFEWQRHGKEYTDVPDYQELLNFLNLRAQASKASTEKKRVSKPITSMMVNTSPADTCAACEKEKHPLYLCARFKSLPHAAKLELLRARNHCLNCLRPGHFAKKCKSLNHCKLCQRPHHTLLHTDSKEREDPSKSSDPPAKPLNRPHFMRQSAVTSY